MSLYRLQKFYNGDGDPIDSSDAHSILIEFKKMDDTIYRLTKALRDIRDKSAPAGYDSGDSGIFKIADDVLENKPVKYNIGDCVSFRDPYDNKTIKKGYIYNIQADEIGISEGKNIGKAQMWGVKPENIVDVL